MGTCHHCSAELEKGKPFCTNCGTEIQREALTKSGKKKSGWIIGVISVFLLFIIIGGLWYARELNHPLRLAEKFEQAISGKDAGELASILKVTEKQAELLIKEYSQSPDAMLQEMDKLKQQAEDLYGGTNVYQDQVFKLKPVGKKWLLFDMYTVEAEKVYITASANKNIDIIIDGDKQGTLKRNEEKTYGPFLPGSRLIQAIYKAKYTEVKEEQTLNSFEVKDKTMEAEFDMTGNQVYISSNNEDAELYLNGKTTGLKISQASPFGPVAVDGSAKIQAVLGDQKSSIETISAADQDVELFFDEEKMAVGNADAEKMVIKNIVENHYTSISNGHYQAAYDLFSKALQSKNTFNHWSGGLKNNFKNEITYMEITEASPTNAVVTFTLDSYDTRDDGFTQVQTWGGKWHLIFEGGWKLDNPEIKKLGSRIE